VVRERIGDVDDRARRLAYAAVEWRATHHNASIQVCADGDHRSRVIWMPTCCRTIWPISSAD
jgi:hypothetical protein